MGKLRTTAVYLITIMIGAYVNIGVAYDGYAGELQSNTQVGASDGTLLGDARPLVDGAILVPEDYATIQAAIDAASDGDIVVVADGTLREQTTSIWTSAARQSPSGRRMVRRTALLTVNM